MHMRKEAHLVIIVSALVSILLLVSGCLHYYVVLVTRIVVDGCVRDSETRMPLSKVAVEIGGERVTGAGQFELIGWSADDGVVHAQYERKWGCQRSALAVWSGRLPKVEVSVRLSREGYQSVQIPFRLAVREHSGQDMRASVGVIYLVRK